jgi:hypothetical protein
MRSQTSSPGTVAHLEGIYKSAQKRHHRKKDPLAGIFIRFQLRGHVSEPVRIFQTNDIEVLFQRAREFYNITDGRLGLWCSAPGVKGVRYIFVGEGGTNEFRILQTLIRNMGVINENVLVEVRPHEPAVPS